MRSRRERISSGEGGVDGAWRAASETTANARTGSRASGKLSGRRVSTDVRFGPGRARLLKGEATRRRRVS